MPGLVAAAAPVLDSQDVAHAIICVGTDPDTVAEEAAPIMVPLKSGE